MYNHFVENNSNSENPLSQVIYTQKENGDLVNITKSNYKVVLKDMVAEYPELSTRVGTKGYTFKYITKTIAAYNSWMADNGEEVALGM